MLTNRVKKDMARCLEDYRNGNSPYRYLELNDRLLGLPMRCSRELFRTERLTCVNDATFWTVPFPCKAFGRHLVLKIVDELLDLGTWEDV